MRHSMRRLRLSIFILSFAILPLAGCFDNAAPNQLSCTSGKYCPDGYVCVRGQAGAPGRCQKANDGGSLDTISADAPKGANAIPGPTFDASVDSVRPTEVANIDALPGVDLGADAAAAPVDSASDVPAPVGIDGSVDSVVISDAPADHPALPDVPPVSLEAGADAGLDVAPPTSPEAGSDAATDAPAVATADASGKTSGTPCASGPECASSYCVDGVCCDGPCSGQCQSCAEANKAGSCMTVTGAPRGTRPACAGGQSLCAGSCQGSASQCNYPGATTICSAALCSTDSSIQSASVCNAAGACTAPTVSDCAASKYCATGSCVDKISNGNTCQNNDQCSFGNCSGGLCCAVGETACSGVCVSLSGDRDNCGICGRVCKEAICSGGTCYLNDGQSCTAGSQCQSGACSTFYLDADGDGYGTTPSAMCGTTPPSGYAAYSGDCCADDKHTYPGSTYTSTSPNKCGNFNYSCS